MNVKKCAGFAATAVALCLYQPLFAYELLTHRNFSTTAASASALGDITVINNLGLQTLGSTRSTERLTVSIASFSSISCKAMTALG